MPSVSRSIAVNSVGHLTAPLLALATQPLLALGLGVSGRGELAAAVAPLMLVGAILTLGLPEAFTYYVARGSQNLTPLFVRGFAVLGMAGLAGSGLIAVIAPVLTDDEMLAGLIVIAGLGLVPSLLVAGLRGMTAGHHDWRRITFERIIGAVGRFLTVLVLFASGGLTPLSATIAFAVTNFVGGIVYLWPRRTGRRDPGRNPLDRVDEHGEPLPDPERVSVVSYGFRIWLGTLAGILMSRFDQVLMTPLTTTEQIGLYAVAVSVSEVALVLNASIREVMFSVETEAPSVRRTGLASRLSTSMTLGISLVAAALAPWAFPWLFGAGFADAVPVLWLLQLGVVLGNPGSVAGVALSARGHPGLRSAAIGIAVVVNIALVVLLVPSHGAIGAATATLAGNAVAGNLCILFLRVRFGVPIREFYAFRPTDLQEFRGALRSVVGRRGGTP